MAISVGTIALCVAVILLSVFIVLGFKHEVERKEYVANDRMYIEILHDRMSTEILKA